MAAPARRLSNLQLFKILDIDPDMQEFIDVHKGNEANLTALFDNIATLKEKSPQDYERINAAAMNVQDPDDMIEALCTACAALGVGSARAPLLALKVARAAAALAAASAEGAGARGVGRRVWRSILAGLGQVGTHLLDG
jgi:magnesium chelatase subunit D